MIRIEIRKRVVEDEKRPIIWPSESQIDFFNEKKMGRRFNILIKIIRGFVVDIDKG